MVQVDDNGDANWNAETELGFIGRLARAFNGVQNNMSEQTSRPAASIVPKSWRRKLFARSLATLGVVASVATGTWAVEESAKVNLGLRGIFPATAPETLNAEAFSQLNGNWAEWSKETADLVGDFYSKLESTDAAAQRTALKALQHRLDVMQRSINDPKYRSLLAPLTQMHARLAERVDFATGALDTLGANTAEIKATKLANGAQGVQAAIGQLEAALGKIQNGPLWIPHIKADAVQKSLASGAGSEAALAAVRDSKERLAGRASLTDEKQKEFLSRPFFTQYEASLDQFLAAANWQPAAGNDDEVRAQLKAVLEAADSYGETRSSEDAGKARAAFAALCKVAPDGGDRMSAVLQKHIFNYNVRIFASEELLNRILSESRTEKGPVVDYVLGANVSGNQTTLTTVGLDLQPSAHSARFDLVLNGKINSNTVGVTSEATVYTLGNHTFVARKEINFNGVSFVTAPATIQVNPHNTTTGIATNMGGLLFGGIAQNIASREVEARRGTAEAIAASRVRDRVLPPFNKEVDKEFAEAGPKLEKEVFSGLKATGLYPDAFVYQTTDTSLYLSSRLMASKELGASLPSVPAVLSEGAILQMHESAVNNSIDRIGLAGQTLTESELRAKLEGFLSKALGRPVKLEPTAKPAEKPVGADKPAADEEGEDGDDKKISAIMFAESDPLRIQFNDGQLVLVMRAGFKQEGKDDIPTREITVPLSFTVKGDKVSITRGSVRVVAADGEGGGIAINGVVRRKIQSTMPDKDVSGLVDLKGPKTSVKATITSIKLLDGWVHVSVK